MANKKSCPSPGSKRKFKGESFTLKSTHKKKTDAKATNESIKKKGCKALVVKNKCGNAVYQRCK